MRFREKARNIDAALVADFEAGAAYLLLSDTPVDRTIEPAPGIMIDLDADGQAVGIEILNSEWVDAITEAFTQ